MVKRFLIRRNRASQKINSSWVAMKLSNTNVVTGVGEYAGLYSMADLGAWLATLKADNEAVKVLKCKIHFTMRTPDCNYSTLTPVLVRARNGTTFTSTLSANTEIQGVANTALDKPFSLKIGSTRKAYVQSLVPSSDNLEGRVSASWDITSFAQEAASKQENGEELYPPEFFVGLFATQTASTTTVCSLVIEVRYGLKTQSV